MAVAGFYVAIHPWLEREGMLKVGKSTRLGERLYDSSYITCFPEGWRFVMTIETKNADDESLIETFVLNTLASSRVDGRELVRAAFDEVKAAAFGALQQLGISNTDILIRYNPSYPRIEPYQGQDTNRGPESSASLDLSSIWYDAESSSEISKLLGDVHDYELPSAIGHFVALDETLLDETVLDETVLDETVLDETVLDETVLDETVLDETLLDETDLDEADLVEADLDKIVTGWGETTATDTWVTPVLEDREYQKTAASNVMMEFEAKNVTILQMACRSGKTRVAHMVMMDFIAHAPSHHARILYLVPSLPLLRQTAYKLDMYTQSGDRIAYGLLLMGSDPKPVMLGASAHFMTTSPTDISAALDAGLREERALIVISTYQSSVLLSDDTLQMFDLTVFDEAHRVCGNDKNRPFNYAFTHIRTGKRLFMTATPRYDNGDLVSMKSREQFGGVAFRYHLRWGIDAKYVNDFDLVICGAAAERETDSNTRPIVQQICRAQKSARKLLVFCRNIKDAIQMAKEAGDEIGRRAAGGPIIKVYVAHSKLPAGIVTKILRAFGADEDAILFNCRLLQEGVEIPSLNGVFFAAPRNSPRDIIQSLCRPLNYCENKPKSKVFIPVEYDPAEPADSPANIRKFATLIPFTDALLDEDPSLYEYLLDPVNHKYSIHWVPHGEVEEDALSNSGPNASKIIKAIRRAVRYVCDSKRVSDRMMRNERVPWSVGYKELYGTVHKCKRYPKTTDAWRSDPSACFHGWYAWCVKEYLKAKDGKKSALEPHQLFELQQLPSWDTYGCSFPYPATECLAFLEKWLGDHEGSPPMVEINRGGHDKPTRRH